MAAAVGACGPNSAADAGDDAAQGTTSEDSGSSHGRETTDESSGTTMAGDTADSSGGAVCGNRQLEGDERCDDASVSCTADCDFACELPELTVMALTSTGHFNWLAPPTPVLDGSGDYIVPNATAIHRIDAAGNEVWVRSTATAQWFYHALLADDGETFWHTGLDDQLHAMLSVHRLDDGTELDAAVFGDMNASGRLAYDASGNLLHPGQAVGVGGVTGRVTARDPGTGEVLWTSMVSREPLGQFEFVGHLAVAPDGSIYASGINSLDDSTQEPWLLRLSADGEEMWQLTVFGGPGPYHGVNEGLAAHGDGVVLLAARQESLEPVIGNLPAVTTHVAFVRDDGELVWEVDPSDEAGADVQLGGLLSLSPDRIAITGTVVVDGWGSPWFGLLDAQGSLLCQASQAGPNGREGFGAALGRDPDGAILVTGADVVEGQGTEVAGRWLARVGG